MSQWARDCAIKVSAESFERIVRTQKQPRLLDDNLYLRQSLLDFIADYADWDNSNDPDYLETSRSLVLAAHKALGGAEGMRPLVVDPFSGGGAIPLEALRLGADVFASDINRVAVLIERATLSTIPQMSANFGDQVRGWGTRVLEGAQARVGSHYPSDGGNPVAYFWARTATCEGPSCGALVPLLGWCWLAKKRGRSWALIPRVDARSKRIDFEIRRNPKLSDVPKGFCAGGALTCPVCGFTTPADRVRDQLRSRRGGSWDAQLLAVAESASEGPKTYRLPTETDRRVLSPLERFVREGDTWLPDTELPPKGTLGFRIQNYGMKTWSDTYLPRQLVVLDALATEAAETRQKLIAAHGVATGDALYMALTLTLGKCIDYSNTLTRWVVGSDTKPGEFVGAANGGENKLSMKWDFVETNPLADGSGSWAGALEWVARVCDHLTARKPPGMATVAMASATDLPLPDQAASVVVTDPPYYDAFAYGALSEMFYVWLRRLMSHREEFAPVHSMTAEEIVADTSAVTASGRVKDRDFFEGAMSEALASAHRVCSDSGLAVVVFAHKDTASWEALLNAFVSAQWTIVASWPIDTERAARPRALRSAALGSSIHIVARKGPLDGVGDWRDVLAELPRRIREWLPRLAAEGIVGADAIFACLGPALGVFSRYARVEKASGERVMLPEYLEHVWAAVAREALSMIFAGAETSGFEEDARLTAMWLWTLSTGAGTDPRPSAPEDDDAGVAEGERVGSPKGTKGGGFALEFDAARKIAQGLGAHLEDLQSLVEVSGETARLLAVAERTRALFGKVDSAVERPRRQRKSQQLALGFVEHLEEAEVEVGWGPKGTPPAGQTVLDRVHQSMILFGAGRSEALRRFLVDEGAGRDARFWVLAQALAALYPPGTDERRWVEGVLARKKSLGF